MQRGKGWVIADMRGLSLHCSDQQFAECQVVYAVKQTPSMVPVWVGIKLKHLR